jgi:purine/pyrimidine-nucleoside phosphorylase
VDQAQRVLGIGSARTEQEVCTHEAIKLSTPAGRATVGMIEPGRFAFSTSSRERIVLVEGSMKVRLPGAEWAALGTGQEIVVKAGDSFDIDAQAHVAYICYYG